MAISRQKKVDLTLLVSILALMICGYFIFNSASLGLLARTNNIFRAITINQTVYGLIGGTIAMYITSRIPYLFWKKHALTIFIASIILMLLVFIPNVGYSHGGARRWVDFRFASFQPSEIFKIAFVIFFAAWLSNIKGKVATYKYGTAAYLALCAITGALILTQPDTATFGVIVLTGLVMHLVAGARLRDFFIMLGIGIIGLLILALARPYVMDRLETFWNPAHNPSGQGYQIQQSMIAIGSGGVFGRGFGQSVQKFNFLPEPMGDSIYAVAAEEFGFVGSVGLIFLYIFFAFRGFKIAIRAPDLFGGLLATGIVILIITGSLINISSMLGIFPLSGIPLAFVSHGGTALFITLAQAGILLNISRFQKA